MAFESVGRYRLHRKLANGNMGEVFLAEYAGEVSFRRYVVVKRLFAHLAHHPEAVRMFQEEAHTLAQLNHPNIPQVYDLGFTDGHWYIAMEHVPGHTLAELCAAGARGLVPLTLDVTVAALEQLCDALHHAHERNDPEGKPLRIVHRDVTPTNLMITPDGYAKLLDFGVAHSTRDGSRAGEVRGTLAYMAPEQVRGQRLDKRSDVFAVGVMLYELTTGRRLFYGGEVEVMTSIVERDVTPPSEWVQGYPAELEQIVLTALARDRSKRYPSAHHLCRDLEDYVASHGMIATHQTLARYYAQVFTEDERRERGSGAFRAIRPVELTPTTLDARAAQNTSVNVLMGPSLIVESGALEDLQSLRGQPPSEHALPHDAPYPLHLPGGDELFHDNSPPLVLSRPKK
ncbi:MAG TPA: serine/threonine-protein kinase [Polyangiales bacterium]